MAAGFYWGANNPYMRSIWVRVRRAPRGLNPSIAMIGPDANPAHIIFECMTNRDWGMGASLGIFDIPSFENCAQTLFDEAFGMSLIWTRSTTIENFITEIIDHIHATIYVNPRTGLMTLKLLREDFDYNSLRVISPDNAKLSNFQRKTWGETSNELVVTWTNPLNEQEETVAAQDIANIAMQGGVISNGRNYYGLRNKDIAARVAERDLRAGSMPLASCDVELDRTLWDIVPGEVVKLTWPEKGIQELVVRMGVINYGKQGSSALKANLYEDVFSLAAAQYLIPPDTEWVDPSEDPAPLDYSLVLTAPAFITSAALGLTSPADLIYPEVITLILAAPDSRDDLNFELIGQVAEPNGSLIYSSFGTRFFVGGAALFAGIPAEAETTLTGFADTTGGTPLAGQFLVLGDGDDETTEITMIKEVTETGWILSRGVLDTVPRDWAAGTRVWSIPSDRVITDITRRSDTESPEYRLLTRTSRGLLAFADSTPEVVALTGRPHYPNRPANCRIGSTGFGTHNAEGESSLALTWENRNRLMETSQVLSWTSGTIVPETGQTTTITVLSSAGDVISTIDGITGTSYSLPILAFSGSGSGRVRFTAKRDGFESLQGHEIAVSGMSTTTVGLSGSESGNTLIYSGDETGKVLLSAPEYEISVLATLALSGGTIVENAGAGTIVGRILNRTPGAAVTITNTAGSRFAIVGENVVAGSVATDYETATSHTIQLTETLVGATGSPNATSLTVSVQDVSEVVPKTYADFQAYIDALATGGTRFWSDPSNIVGAYRTTVGAATGAMNGSSWLGDYGDASLARVVQHGLPSLATLTSLNGKQIFLRLESTSAAGVFGRDRNGFVSSSSDFGEFLPVYRCTELLFFTDQPYKMNPYAGTGPTPYTW